MFPAKILGSLGRHQWIFNLIELLELENHLTTKSSAMTQEEKQHKANEIIKNHVGFSLGAALMPFPGTDLLAVSGVQLNMLRQLAKLYNVGFLDKLGKNIISALVGSSAARLGASLVKAIPGVGTVIGELTMPALSGASTYALGRVVASHFAQGGTFEDFDLSLAKKKYKNEMEKGKEVAVEMEQTTPPPAPETADSMADKLRKFAAMRDEGLLTEDEFQQIKTRIIAQI